MPWSRSTSIRRNRCGSVSLLRRASRQISLLLERKRPALDPVALRRHRRGGARLGNLLLGPRQYDRRTSRARRRDARHHRSAAARPAARLEPGRVSRRNLDRLMEPTLEIADRALDRIVAQGSFEFINDFSSQITVGLLFRTMGLPERDHAESGARSFSRSRPTKRRRAARPNTSPRSRN